MARNSVSEELLAGLGLSASGVKYVLEAAASEPSRRVGTHRRANLILDVPIDRLGVVLQAESLTGEYMFLVEQQHNDDLIAIYDQPPPVCLQITDSSRRRTRVNYTADYLVIDSHGVFAKEIKSDGDLDDLVRKRPLDWQLTGPSYVYRPARDYFANLGISHDVVPISTFNSVRTDNLRLLSSIKWEQPSPQHLRLSRRALQIVQAETAVRIGDVLERLEEEDATIVLRLIGNKEIFADLDNCLLSNPGDVWVATSLELACSYELSHRSLHKLATEQAMIGGDSVIDPRYLREVVARTALIEGLNDPPTSRSARTLRRYRKRMKAAGGSVMSLIPNWRNCGNRDARISATHKSFIAQHIRSSRGNQHFRSTSKSYRDYKLLLPALSDQTGFEERPVSRSTYYTLWHKVAKAAEDAAEQGGRRLAHHYSDAYDPSRRSLIATRPFSVAHIDHWNVDIHLVVGRQADGKLKTRRPWMTAMVDAFTGEILSAWLAFSHPSKKSCTMVIRECVQKHRRLPEILITDAGAEFRSVHFSTMLAALKVTRAERPPEAPRFGKEVERVFGHFKERFIRGLPGYGISIEQARAVSSGFQAPHKSKLDLLGLRNALQLFIDAGYNQSPKPGEQRSRIEVRSETLRQLPSCGRKTDWTQSFLISTAIEPPDSSYKLWPRRGIRIGVKWYSSPGLLAFCGHKKDLVIRVEPYDDSVIYVNVDNQWHVCHSGDSVLASTFTDAQLAAITTTREELRSLTKNLADEHDMIVAKLVDDCVSDASQQDSMPPSLGTTSPPGDGEETLKFLFDDVKVLEEQQGGQS